MISFLWLVAVNLSRMLVSPSSKHSVGFTNALVSGTVFLTRLFGRPVFDWLSCVMTSSMLAMKLNMSRDDAERWIVNLIRNAKLDAKIDAKEVCSR